MKSLFDPALREEIIRRIEQLHTDSRAMWGKMTVYQMINHCIRWNEMIEGKRRYSRTFMGMILGKWLLKNSTKDDAPMAKGTPTMPDLLITEKTGDIEFLKKQWIEQVKNFEKLVDLHFTHPFFGKMTREQIGIHAYKHLDHHLRQFNC